MNVYPPEVYPDEHLVNVYPDEVYPDECLSGWTFIPWSLSGQTKKFIRWRFIRMNVYPVKVYPDECLSGWTFIRLSLSGWMFIRVKVYPAKFIRFIGHVYPVYPARCKTSGCSFLEMFIRLRNTGRCPTPLIRDGDATCDFAHMFCLLFRKPW